MTFAELTPGQLRRDPLPLRGRVAVITGVSRRAGIGYAIARRLAAQSPGNAQAQRDIAFGNREKGGAASSR